MEHNIMTQHQNTELPETIYAETKGTNRIWRPFYEQADVPHDGVGEYRLVSIGTRALTPESEGIAGKVDKAVENEKIKKRLMEKQDQFWANGNLMADEVQVIKESLTTEPTLTRPQEIDVNIDKTGE